MAADGFKIGDGVGKPVSGESGHHILNGAVLVRIFFR